MSLSLLQYRDDALLSLLKRIQDKGHFNHAAVAVLRDGMRLGEFSTTHVGRLERQLPFLCVCVPESLKTNYPWTEKNLMLNSERIVTTFNVYKSVQI